MSEQTENSVSSSPEAAAQRPRDAATLILVDTSSGAAKVLMGKRRMDLVFMPGKFVFPGGRVDPSDKDVFSADELPDDEVSKLLHDMKGHPSRSRARGLAMAGIREVFEETGIIIGRPEDSPPSTESDGWRPFFESGFVPVLSNLCFFARAITPPGRPRRYDTRFFFLPAQHIGLDTGKRDEELSEIGWYTIKESTELDLPPITRVVLEDLQDQLQAGTMSASRPAVPYYHQRRGTFFRDLINAAD